MYSIFSANSESFVTLALGLDRRSILIIESDLLESLDLLLLQEQNKIITKINSKVLMLI